MSDCLLEYEKQNLDFKLSITVPPLSYIHQQHIAEKFTIALAIDIPYPVLKLWHGLAGSCKDERGNCHSMASPQFPS